MYNIKKIIVILGFIFLSTNAAQAREWQDVVVLSVNGESVSLNSEVGGQLWGFLDKTTQQKTQRYASRCIDEKSISCDKSLLDKEIAKINRQANVVTQMLRVDLTDTSVPYILLIQN